MIGLAIVEDDKHIRTSLMDYFSNQEDIHMIHSEDSVEKFLNWISITDQKPDVILLDVSLPGMTGIDGIQKIREIDESVSIIMLTIHDDSDRVFRSFTEGADGYLLKSTPLAKIKEGLLDIQQNGAPMSPSIAKKVIRHFAQKKPEKKSQKAKLNTLTPREKEVVNGLVEGFSYKEVASNLELAVETIRHHVKNIYSKLHVNSKSQVVAKSLRGEIE
jgi:DNA-binding NarL/FixJ family response regulator